MSAEHEIRTVVNTIAAAALGWNATGREPSNLYRAVAVALRESLAGPDASRVVYRAEHESIVMGLYTNREAAQAHCEAEERRAWAAVESLSFDWIEDEEDGVAELTVWADGEECTTGYVVTALEVAAEYDEEADE